MMTDDNFVDELDRLQNAVNELKQHFKSYNFKDYIEQENDVKNLKAKARVYYDMVEIMVNNRLDVMKVAEEAIEFRKLFIKQISNNPHVKEQWDTIMSTLSLLR